MGAWQRRGNRPGFGWPAAVLGGCLAAAAAWGQSAWSDVQRPGSATISALTAVSSGLLAGSVSGRVFLSSDGGKTWTQSSLRAGSAIGGFLETGKVLLAWAGVPKHPLADCFQLIPCDDGTRPGGLFRSADGGKTWARVGPDYGVTAVVPSGNSLYANSQGDLFRSTDGGLAWTKLGLAGGSMPGLDRMEVLGNTVVGSAYASQYSRGTLDGDRIRWDDHGPGYLLTKHQGYLYAWMQGPAPSSRSGLQRTRDGRTWELVSERRFQRMASAGDRLIGLGLDTLFESGDGGKTWTEIAGGFLEGQLHRAMVERAGTVFIGGSTSKGVLALADGARAWLNQGMHDAPPGPLHLENWHILLADPNRMLMTRSLVFWPNDWRDVRVDGQVPRGVTHFGSLGGSVFAFNAGLTWRSDDFGRDPRLGPYAWRKDTLTGSRGSATGRGWLAVFRDGDRITLCEGLAPVACRDGDTQALPVEIRITSPVSDAITYKNRFRAMTAAGDSLAILLDSLYVSPDRGRTFRNFGLLDASAAWVAFHHGQLYAGGETPSTTQASGLLRLDPARGGWEDVPLAGVKAGVRVQAMASHENGLFIATSDGVYRRDKGENAWSDFSDGLPARNAVSIAYANVALVVGLETGQVMTRWLHPIGVRPEARRAGAQPSRLPPGRFADPAGRLRRADGRASMP